METIKQADMDANPEEYLDRCEAGEMFLVEQPDGRIIAMVPEDQFKDIESDDDYYKNYNHTDI
tara:strand:+ start:619 stop:807 length:189 start_codon:yes stop_codon:yes gene_type:complete